MPRIAKTGNLHQLSVVQLTGNSAANAQLGTAGHDTNVHPCIKWTMLDKCKNHNC